jgi:hypothetical protein
VWRDLLFPLNQHATSTRSVPALCETDQSPSDVRTLALWLRLGLRIRDKVPGLNTVRHEFRWLPYTNGPSESVDFRLRACRREMFFALRLI